MKTPTRLALAATFIALILYGVNPRLFGKESTGFDGTYYDMGQGLIWVLLGIWAMKFILGSMIDKKAEPKE